MNDQTSAREDQLFALLADCIEAGESDSRLQARLIADNPEFADELNQYFTMQQEVDGVTGPLRNLRGSIHDTVTAEASDTWRVTCTTRRPSVASMVVTRSSPSRSAKSSVCPMKGMLANLRAALLIGPVVMASAWPVCTSSTARLM